MDVECNFVDTDAFISELKKCPCIWNYKSEQYSNQIEWNSAWAAVC